MKVRVDEILDGDTLLVNQNEKVRFIGINTPEKSGPYTEAEDFHYEASEYLEHLLTGELVWLDFDRERRDHYGRMLAYVFHEGIFLNAEMVRQGYAKPLEVRPNTRFSKYFKELEKRAKKTKLECGKGKKAIEILIYLHYPEKSLEAPWLFLNSDKTLQIQ